MNAEGRLPPELKEKRTDLRRSGAIARGIATKKSAERSTEMRIPGRGPVDLAVGHDFWTERGGVGRGDKLTHAIATPTELSPRTLFGSALFMISGLGQILVAGPLVAWIVAALEGALVVGGLSALGVGLYSIGIPKDSIVKYEKALQTDQFLLIVHGTAAEVANAKEIIETTHPAELGVHSGEAVTAAA